MACVTAAASAIVDARRRAGLGAAACAARRQPPLLPPPRLLPLLLLLLALLVTCGLRRGVEGAPAHVEAQRAFYSTHQALLTALIPPISAKETPLAIRDTSLVDTLVWNCVATYSASWNDALTLARPFLSALAPRFMHQTSSRVACMAAAVERFSVSTDPPMPAAAAGVRDVAASSGIDLLPNLDAGLAACVPPGTLFDPNTHAACVQRAVSRAWYNPAVVGQALALQVQGHAARDGWNSRGDVNADGSPCTANCRPFGDTTGYAPRPLDTASASPSWQPLLEDNGIGFFYRQEHVTPHIGARAALRVLPESERAARAAPPPDYNYTQEMALLLERVAALDDKAKMEVEFHDNKIGLVLAVLVTMREGGLFPSFEAMMAYAAGDTAAALDATVIVWKEKVAHDLVRPTTLIHETLGATVVNAWAGPFQGVRAIAARDFQPYIRVMPHSEYPSGSGCICQSISDYADSYLQGVHGNTNITLMLPTPAGSSRVEPGAVPARDLILVYEGMAAVTEACSQSRLWGGMHFTASVPASRELCRGIGSAGYEFATRLMDGKWE